MLQKLSNYFNKTQFDFKNNAFDFIRLVLAIGVIFFHSHKLFPQHNNWFYYELNNWDRGWASLGGILVALFFAISGFLITRSAFGSQDFVDFAKKRFLRIYPAYFVSLVLTCFFFAPILAWHYKLQNQQLNNAISESLTFFFRNLFIETPVNQIPSVEGDFTFINGSYWTLWQEWRAYFFVGVIAIFSNKIKLNPKFLILAITVLLQIVYYFGISDPKVFDWFSFVFTDFRFIALLCYFFVGASFWVLLDKIRWNILWFVISLIGIYLAFTTNNLPLLFPICSTYSILYLSQIFPIRNLTKKYGDWSYGAYVYASPIQLVLTTFGFGSLGFWGYNILSTILALFFGFVSWHLVEKPFLTRK